MFQATDDKALALMLSYFLHPDDTRVTFNSEVLRFQPSFQGFTVQSSHSQQTTILIVDELTIAGLMRSLLEMQGYRTIVTESPVEGCSLYFTNQDQIDLIIVGLFLLNWTILTEMFRKEHRESKILYTSGYSFSSLVKRGALKSDDHFLLKPFGIEEFYRKIREVLD